MPLLSAEARDAAVAAHIALTEKIEAHAASALPGRAFTFGYIGNCDLNCDVGFDDRAWYLWFEDETYGTGRVSIGGRSTADLASFPDAIDRYVARVPQLARDLFALVPQLQAIGIRASASKYQNEGVKSSYLSVTLRGPSTLHSPVELFLFRFRADRDTTIERIMFANEYRHSCASAQSEDAIPLEEALIRIRGLLGG